MAGAPPTRTLYFARTSFCLEHLDQAPLVGHGRRQQGREADEVRPDGLGPLEEPLELDVGPEVEDFEAAGLEHGGDEVLADVVDVALDRADDDLAPAPRLEPRALELGLEDGHGRLHGLGARDELGQEVLALLPELADLLDARDVAVLDDVEEVQPGPDGLPGQPAGGGAVAVDDGLPHVRIDGVLVHSRLLKRDSAMASMKAGLVPQHPPTRFAPPRTMSGTKRT